MKASKVATLTNAVAVKLEREREAKVEKERNGDPLTPAATVLIKLGSLAVHVEEMLSPDGLVFDRNAVDLLLQDPELIAWREQMDKMAFLPKKRKP